MGFRDFFKPKWEHSDLNVRLDAVREIKDEKILAKIAMEDQNWYVGNCAVKNINNQEVLTEIAINSTNEFTCEAAVKKLKAQVSLVEVAKSGQFWRAREAAVKKITSQATIADIAKNDKSWSVRRIAVEKLNPNNFQDLLIEIAKKDEDKNVRESALEKISIVKNDKTVMELRWVQMLKEEIFEKLTEPRILNSGISFKYEDIVATFSHLHRGDFDDYKEFSSEVYQAIRELVSEGKLSEKGGWLSARKWYEYSEEKQIQIEKAKKVKKKPNVRVLVSMIIMSLIIIGLLAYILIPDLIIRSLNNKIKITFKDMWTISWAIETYKTIDENGPQTKEGIYNEDSEFYKAVCPSSFPNLPIKDPWGNNYLVFTSKKNDYTIVCSGRNGKTEALPEGKGSDFFEVKTVKDYDNDIVVKNGKLIKAPKFKDKSMYGRFFVDIE